MSSNKKIDNRLNKLFDEIKHTEEEKDAPASVSKPVKHAPVTPSEPPKKPIHARSLSPSLLPPRPKTITLEQGPTGSSESMVTIPFQAGENWSMIELGQDSQRHWNEDEQSLVQQVADQLGLALNNAHLFEETKKSAQQMAAVAEIATRISTILELQTLIETAVRLTQQRFGLYHAHLFMKQDDNKTFSVKACGWDESQAHGKINDTEHVNIDIDAAISIVARAARTKTAVIVNDVHADPAWLPNPLLPDVQSEMAIPVISSAEEVLAVLNVHSNELNHFLDPDLAIMTTLAAQIGSAIQNARLFNDTQRYAEETALINTIVAEAAYTLDLHKSLNGIVIQVANALSLADVNIALIQPSGKLDIEAEVPQAETEFTGIGIELSANEPIFKDAFVDHQPVTITDVPNKSLPEGLKHIASARKTQTLILAPIVAQDQVIGLMGLYIAQPDRELSPDEYGLVITIITQVSITIQNARLYEETQKRASELTTLNEIVRAVSQQIELKQVLDAAYHQIQKLVPVDAFIVALYDEKTNLVSYPIVIDEEKYYEEPDAPLNPDNYSSQTIMSGQVLQLMRKPEETATNKEKTTDALGNTQKTTGSLLFIPLKLGQKTIGCFSIQSYSFFEYQAADVTLLENISNQLTVAIQNARLYEQEQYGRNIADALSEMARIAGSTLDLKEVVRRLLRQMPRLFQFHTASIQLVAEDEKRQQVGSITLNKEAEPELETPDNLYLPPIKEDLLINEVYDSKETLVIPDTDNDPRWKKTRGTKHTHSWICTPLLVGDDVIGFLVLEDNDANTYNADLANLANSIAAQASAAIQNARLYENTQRSLDDLGLINRLVSAVSGSLDLQSSLQYVAEEMIKAFNISHVGIALFNQTRTRLTLTADSPLPADGKGDIGIELSLTRNKATEEVINTKKPIFIEDISNEPRLGSIREMMERRETKNLLIVPLLSGNEVVGVADFESSDSNRTFTDEEIRLIQTIFFQVASSIRNAQLFQQTQDSEEALRRQNEYLATAAEVSRLISSTLDLPTLFERAVNLIQSRFKYYHVAVFTVEETGFNTVLREATGAAGVEMKKNQHSLPVGSKSIMGTVTSNGETLVVNNTALESVHRPNPLLPDTRAEAGIPLKIGTRVIGAVDIQSKDVNAFHSEDIAVLQTLADQIAVAIDNARSYDIAQKAVDEMRELDRIKSQFLANMSHELRTPLNSIIGFSRVILKGIDGPITDQQNQDLGAIYNSGQHLLGLINDILDLSKIEAGKMELSLEEMNIGDTIASVMSTATGLVKDKTVKLKQEIEPNLPTIRADPMRIRQILLNLISNAAKFTEEGSITVSAAPHKGPIGQLEVMVSVTDTGPGISAEDQTKLFQAFSQLDSSPTRKTGGTGLGLSIAQRMVDMHGGRIGIHSVVGKGSTFYFTIPQYNQPSIEPIPGQGKVILCIDDDQQVIGLYDRYLKPQGYQVIPVTNPAAARDTIKRLKPYAVTLDIMMPGMDGWTLLQEIRTDPETHNVPVIICSIVEEEEKGFSLGASDYLVKPILEDDLLGALNRLNGDGTIKDVLIIDDSVDDLRLMEKVIAENTKFRPTLAEGGQKGWEMIINDHPHAIILDLFMPDLNGFTILERLRTTPELRDIPVIVVSGVDLNSEQKQQLENLGKQLLQKGMLDEKELFALLGKALKRLEPR